MLKTKPPAVLIRWRRAPVATSHSRTVPSASPVATTSCAGPSTTGHAHSLCPDKTWRTCPVAGSHSRTVPSLEPVTSTSRPWTTANTRPVWPCSVRSGRPLTVPHMSTPPSSPPIASVPPSGP